MATLYYTGATDATWTNTGNWVESDGTAPSAVPGTGDSVVFDARATRSLTGSPSGTIRLVKVQVMQSMGYYIGTPAAPITAAVDTFIVGEETEGGGTSNGSQQICWDFGATASGYNGTTARIVKSNTTGLSTTGLEAVQLKGTHASNVLIVEGQSSVGFGVSFPGQTYTVATVSVVGDNAKVRLGSGGTLTTINQSKGNLVVEAAFTTLNQTGGTCRTEGTGAITTANVNGTFIGNSSGTITTIDVEDQGFGDFTKSAVSRTVTNATTHGRGRIDAENGVAGAVTFTNGVICIDGARTNQVNFGQQRKVTPAAP